ncbi:hypothetical protein TNCV_552051 [Trichonephila clavipes]|nr:hypothetical protein TNCV_552051 [Trichonephila clavipes]
MPVHTRIPLPLTLSVNFCYVGGKNEKDSFSLQLKTQRDSLCVVHFNSSPKRTFLHSLGVHVSCFQLHNIQSFVPDAVKSMHQNGDLEDRVCKTVVDHWPRNSSRHSGKVAINQRSYCPPKLLCTQCQIVILW